MTPPEDQFTYGSVGATREEGMSVPDGYSAVLVRTRIGDGVGVFRTAAEAVLTWRMHRRLGVAVQAAPRAEPGGSVIVGFGIGRLLLRAPCRVVWVEECAEAEGEGEGGARAGWAYGTLPGHPVRGEEAFLVTRDADGAVWLTVRAFSRPAHRWVRAVGPWGRWAQRAYARRCGRVLRALSREAPTGPR